MTGTTNVTEITGKVTHMAVDSGLDTAVDFFTGFLPGNAVKGAKLALSAIPGASASIDDAKESLRKSAVELAQNTVNNHPQEVSWLQELIQSVKTFFMDLIVGKDVPARNSMYAQVGITPKGQFTPTTMFDAVNHSLGINVTPNIQEIAQKHIDSMVGIGGMGADATKALKETREAHSEIANTIYTALHKMYAATPPASADPKLKAAYDAQEETLKAVAMKAAGAFTGLNPADAASDNAAERIAQHPPTTGFGAMLLAAQRTGNPTALAIDTSALALATKDLAPFKTEMQQKINETAMAKAKEAVEPTKDAVGKASHVAANTTPSPSAIPAARTASQEIS